MTLMITEGGRALVRDEATGRVEEIELDAAELAALELVLDTDEDISSRHHFAP